MSSLWLRSDLVVAHVWSSLGCKLYASLVVVVVVVVVFSVPKTANFIAACASAPRAFGSPSSRTRCHRSQGAAAGCAASRAAVVTARVTSPLTVKLHINGFATAMTKRGLRKRYVYERRPLVASFELLYPNPMAVLHLRRADRWNGNIRR